MNPQQFIDIIAPIAVLLRKEGSPIFPSVRIAQAALETGWKIPDSNNLVGRKIGNGQTNPYWHGRYIMKDTWEMYDDKRTNIGAAFRVYDTIEDCFRDQDLLFDTERFKQVKEATTPEDQAVALYKSGYATDPAYHQKIINLIRNFNLKEYDKRSEDYMLKVEDANKIIDFLKAGWKVTEQYPEARKEFNRLANELRKASGQEPQ